MIKGFELTLEVSGNLLRKALKSYGATSKEVDALSYKDIFRRAAKHNIVSLELVERWFLYRENRNNTAHDYGIAFAEETLMLLPSFIQDVSYVIAQLNKAFAEDEH